MMSHWLRQHFEDMKEFVMDKVGDVFPTEELRDDNCERLGNVREEMYDFIDYKYREVLEDFFDRAIVRKTEERSMDL